MTFTHPFPTPWPRGGRTLWAASSSVPKGQTHPQKNRPNRRVSTARRRAGRKRARSALAARVTERATRGFHRKKMFTAAAIWSFPV